MENTNQENKEQIVGLTVVEQALEKENITKQIIAKLKSDYSGLKINGIDDVEGFNKVEEARKHCKTVRVTATKICKLGREKAIQEQKDWINKEKEVVNEVSEIESELEAESNRIKEEKERILFEAAQRDKLPARKEKFLTIGITLDDAELLKLDDFNFDKLFNEFYVKHLEEVASKAKEAAEAAAKIEAERLAEEKRLYEEKLAKEAETQRLENERLKKEKEEIERKAKEEKAKADAELAAQKEKADREAERLKKEAEDKLAEEKRLAKIEADKQAAIIAEQQAENARLAKEAKDKADAELAAQQKAKAEEEENERKRLEEEKQAAIAPDKIKLKNYISTFVTVKVEFDLNSEEAKSVKNNIDDKFSAFKNWALSQIEKIK